MKLYRQNLRQNLQQTIAQLASKHSTIEKAVSNLANKIEALQ